VTLLEAIRNSQAVLVNDDSEPTDAQEA